MMVVPDDGCASTMRRKARDGVEDEGDGDDQATRASQVPKTLSQSGQGTLRPRHQARRGELWPHPRIA